MEYLHRSSAACLVCYWPPRQPHCSSLQSGRGRLEWNREREREVGGEREGEREREVGGEEVVGKGGREEGKCDEEGSGRERTATPSPPWKRHQVQ